MKRVIRLLLLAVAAVAILAILMWMQFDTRTAQGPPPTLLMEVGMWGERLYAAIVAAAVILFGARWYRRQRDG